MKILATFCMVCAVLAVVGAGTFGTFQVADACWIQWFSGNGDNGATVTADPDTGIFTWAVVTTVCTATGGSCMANGNVKDFKVRNTPGLNYNIDDFGEDAFVSPELFEAVEVGVIPLPSNAGGDLEDHDIDGTHVVSAWDDTDFECSATFYKTITHG